jgi:hypothetical protein
MDTQIGTTQVKPVNAAEVEKNRQKQKAYMMQKYAANIQNLNRYYGGMETFICFEVLCANARAYARGEKKEIWPGGGSVDMGELMKDVAKLDTYVIPAK